MHRRICERTRERFGRPINPHLFRDAAATSIAIEDPEHVGIVVAILGHSTIKTSERYYNQATGIDAARHYQNVIAAYR
jgi:integrase